MSPSSELPMADSGVPEALRAAEKRPGWCSVACCWRNWIAPPGPTSIVPPSPYWPLVT